MSDPTPIPEWVSNALYVSGGGLLAWFTLFLTGRRDRNSAENQLIDQLQEELAEFRRQTNDRLQKLETENNAYRRYVFQLIDHINVSGITPLPWPDDIPR